MLYAYVPQLWFSQSIKTGYCHYRYATDRWRFGSLKWVKVHVQLGGGTAEKRNHNCGLPLFLPYHHRQTDGKESPGQDDDLKQWMIPHLERLSDDPRKSVAKRATKRLEWF